MITIKSKIYIKATKAAQASWEATKHIRDDKNEDYAGMPLDALMLQFGIDLTGLEKPDGAYEGIWSVFPETDEMAFDHTMDWFAPYIEDGSYIICLYYGELTRFIKADGAWKKQYAMNINWGV